MPKKLKILIAAGGTGGHLFPAMAVVSQIEKQYANTEFTFTGREDKIEGRIIPESKYNFLPIEVRGLVKKLSFDTMKIPFQIYTAYRKIYKVLKINKYDAVICAGAYISYAPGIAASKLGIPLYLLEANVNPGKANAMLSKKAKRVFTSFLESADYLKSEVQRKINYTGNPVRNELINLPDKTAARKSMDLHPDKKTILVFGGSLGATSINNAIDEYISQNKADIQIIWQTGKKFEKQKEYPEYVKLTEFIDDMASAYSAADLVISRSGATTVAELEVTGKPVILVPFPAASTNEQKNNAAVLEKHNAGIMIEEKDLNEKFIKSVNNLIFNEEKLKEISKNLLKLAKPDAAKQAAQFIIKDLVTYD